jgi:preprotein translocase subunit SecE
MEAGFKAVAEKFTDFRRELAKEIADERKSVIIQLGSVIVACFVISLSIMGYWLD